MRLVMHVAHVVSGAFGRKLGAASQNGYSTEIVVESEEPTIHVTFQYCNMGWN